MIKLNDEKNAANVLKKTPQNCGTQKFYVLFCGKGLRESLLPPTL